MKKMFGKNRIPLLFFFIMITGCLTETLDEKAAQNRVEKLMQDISNNKYDGIGKHFTNLFNINEPVETKIEKYQQLKRVLGKLNSMDLLNSTSEANFGEQAKIILQYRIVYENATTIEDFVVVKDDGEYRIASHHIKNE